MCVGMWECVCVHVHALMWDVCFSMFCVCVLCVCESTCTPVCLCVCVLAWVCVCFHWSWYLTCHMLFTYQWPVTKCQKHVTPLHALGGENIKSILSLATHRVVNISTFTCTHRVVKISKACFHSQRKQASMQHPNLECVLISILEPAHTLTPTRTRKLRHCHSCPHTHSPTIPSPHIITHQHTHTHIYIQKHVQHAQTCPSPHDYTDPKTNELQAKQHIYNICIYIYTISLTPSCTNRSPISVMRIKTWLFGVVAFGESAAPPTELYNTIFNLTVRWLEGVYICVCVCVCVCLCMCVC